MHVKDSLSPGYFGEAGIDIIGESTGQIGELVQRTSTLVFAGSERWVLAGNCD